MGKNMLITMASTSFWVAALGLMIAASFTGNLVLAGWSILAGLAGCVFIGWHLLGLVERQRAEEIARVAADAAIRRVRLGSVT